jgi:hypothetical protein
VCCTVPYEAESPRRSGLFYFAAPSNFLSVRWIPPLTVSLSVPRCWRGVFNDGLLDPFALEAKMKTLDLGSGGVPRVLPGNFLLGKTCEHT